MSYKDKNTSHVAPYLIVEDPEELLEFLKVVFQAKQTIRVEDDDGQIRHAQVNINESTIMTGQAGEDWKPNPTMLHVYVEDVDKAIKLALKQGATLSLEIKEDLEAGDRRGLVKGPQGNYWAIATAMNKQ